MKRSGYFKPIGFLSREPEVVLSPGEVIRKKGRVATTLIKNRAVPLYEVEIAKYSSGEVAELFKKLKSGTISPSELKKLKRITKFDYSSASISSKYYVNPLSLSGSGGFLFSSLFSKASSHSKQNNQLIKSKKTSLFSKIPTKTKKSFFTSILKLTATSKLKNTNSYPKISNPLNNVGKIKTNITKNNRTLVNYRFIPPSSKNEDKGTTKSLLKKISKLQQKARSYDVGVVKRGKPKIIKRHLHLNDARDYGAEYVLRNLRATFFLKSSLKKPKDLPDTNVFLRNRRLFRQPFPNSRYRNLGEEVYIQKRRKTNGSGGRLTFKSEILELQRARKKKNKLSLFGIGKKKRKKSIWNF